MAAEQSGNKSQSLLDELRTEFPRVWREIPDKWLFLVLLAAWLSVFHVVGNPTFGYHNTPSLLGWMYGTYVVPNSDDGHGLLIPFVVLGLLWWKREELSSVPKGVWLFGLVLLTGCVALHLTGYLIQQPRVSIVAMLTGIWVLAAIVWGWPLGRAMLFPMVLLVFCVPIGTLADPLTVPLRQLSTDIAVGISRGVLGIPVLQKGVLITDPQGRYHYEVAAACSGIRSLITLFAVNTIYAFLTFKAPWKRLVVIAFALPLALLGNVIRLVGIIVAAEAFGQTAGQVAHDWFGFVTFALALLALAAAGRWLRDPDGPAASPTEPLLAPGGSP